MKTVVVLEGPFTERAIREKYGNDVVQIAIVRDAWYDDFLLKEMRAEDLVEEEEQA